MAGAGIAALLLAAQLNEHSTYVALDALTVSSDFAHYGLELLCDVAAVSTGQSDDPDVHIALRAFVDAVRFDQQSLVGIECLSAAASDQVFETDSSHMHLHFILDATEHHHAGLDLLRQCAL